MMGDNRLKALGGDILRAERKHGRATVKHAMEQGKRVREARDLCPTDRAFGEWRSGIIPDLDQKTLFNYRNLFDWFGDKDIALVEAIGLTRCYKLKEVSVREAVIDYAEKHPAQKITDADIKEIEERLNPSQPDPDPEPDDNPSPTENNDDRPTAKKIAAAERYLELKGTPEQITLREAGASVGATEQVMKTTVQFVHGYRAAATDNAIIEGLNMSQKERIEKAKAKAMKEVDQRVYILSEQRIKSLIGPRVEGISKKVDQLNRRLDNLLKGRSLKISRAEWKAMRMALHGLVSGAEVSEDKARMAYDAFEKLEIEPMSAEEQAMEDSMPTLEEVLAGGR